jgi:HlyD family secretion protein
MRPRARLAVCFALAAALPAVLTACSRHQGTAAAAPARTGSDVIATAPGWVDAAAGTQRLAARLDGVVQSVAVKDGDTVNAGDLLLRLDDHQASIEAHLAEVELARRRAEGEAVRTQYQRQKEEESRLAPLVQQQAEPEDELRQVRRKLAELQSQLTQSGLALQAAQLQQQLAQDKLDKTALRAPARGQVLRLFVHAGEGVSSGAPLLWFAADGPLIVRAELDERLFGQVLPGMAAEVAAEYDDNKVYSARVLRVARTVGPVHELPEVRPAAKDDRVVECVLELDAADLLIGQRVLVRVRGKS